MIDSKAGISVVCAVIRRMRIVACTAGILSSLLYTGVSAGDDTEIYFAKPLTGDQSIANVMFMFDTSGSMSGLDGYSENRITRLKRAMIDLVSTTSNVNIGMGAFNGSSTGGAILHPTINVDADLCPDASCTELELRATVQHPTDDAQENLDGIVDLSSSSLKLNASVPDSSLVTLTYTIQSGADDAIQSKSSGIISIDSPAVELHYDPPSTDTALGETIAGLRFAGVSIPAGATLIDARIKFLTNGDSGLYTGPDSEVSLENNLSAQPFADVDAQRISDRTAYPNRVIWPRIFYSATTTIRSPNLIPLVRQAVDDAAWSGSGDLMFKFERHPNSVLADDRSRRSYRAFESGHATELEITYSLAATENALVGLRFDDLNIPRGATINHAALELNAERLTAANAVTIVGQATDNAEPFTAANNDLSNRMIPAALTSASVTGEMDLWEQKTSSDVTSIIQEIVDRAGWCGGNAMALFLNGQRFGERSAISRDQSQWSAPTLRVNYDPSSVDFNTTCVRQATSTAVQSGTDDVMESSTDGSLEGSSDLLRTHTAGDAQVIGLRFAELDIPQGAGITNAYIRMASGGYVPGNVDLLIDVEATDYASLYNSAVPNALSGRAYSGAGVSWQNVPEVNAGGSMQTPNLKQLVESTVARTKWNNDNAIAFVMSVAGGSTGERLFNSIDATAGVGATLVVHYQRDSASLAGNPVVLKTGRDELIKTMLDLPARGGTPLLDSYYEAAQYMLGGAVDFGKARGEDGRYFRISHPDSYTLTSGTVYRPPECSIFDLNDVACITSEIQGDAFYKQPEFGECQANQIVLLSDGQAGGNHSETKIQSLLSVGACEARANVGENCGVELAQWLFDTDHDPLTEGKQGIVTHTIGFNLSTPFLTDVASAGGGEFYTAESSSDLVQAFSNIIDNAITPDSSFVAPAASVSQTNRLVNSNDIYYAMFKPDKKTIWDGNLKRYQLGMNNVTGIVEVLDALGASASDAADGGISSNATSFWDPTVVDGKDVSKGGAANKLTLNRNLYVSLDDATSGTTALDVFHENTTGINDVLLGIEGTDASYRTEVLQWARGVDLKDFDGDGDIAEVRTQMGDPLHSTQYLLNYKDSAGAETGVIFLGTNQGFLHAINTEFGNEEFAFIPQELLKNLNHYYKNDTVDHDKRPYGLDGGISGWHDDSNHNGYVDNNETAYVFIGMRRGGRNYYALDVSNLSSPQLKWVIKGGAGEFVELGQSWSRAVKAKVNYSGTVKDVLIFAAGYDPDKDNQTQQTFDDEGAGIFIVDAHSGELITSRTELDLTDMRYSIPSDIRVINIDSDGLADILLVGDTGGQLWRFDINNGASTDPTFLTGGVIAELGSVGEKNNRRFFYEPDAALIRDDNGHNFLNISIGSGFRAHPNDEKVEDRFYAIRSDDIFGPPRNAKGAITYSTIREKDLADVSTLSGTKDTSGKINKGWFITLPDEGEKALSTALTVDNTLVFTTYVPAADSVSVCSATLGSGRVYSVDALYGDPAKSEDPDSTEETADLITDRYRILKTPGIPPRVTGLLTESNPNAITQLAGVESIGDDETGAPFERTFWAEE